MQGGGEPDGGRVPARRQDVMAALRRHGISGMVSAALWKASLDLVRRTRRRGVEHAATLDTSDGLPVGPMLTGTASATDVSRHLLAFQPGHEYVQLHTHPRSTSFSSQDLLLLASHPLLCASVVVGVDGTWYVLSGTPGARSIDPRQPFDDYQIAYRDLEGRQIASAERPHTVMQQVSGHHGFRYDRVLG